MQKNQEFLDIKRTIVRNCWGRGRIVREREVKRRGKGIYVIEFPAEENGEGEQQEENNRRNNIENVPRA